MLPQVCVCASIGGAPFLSPHHHKRQLPCYKLHTLLRLCYAIGTPPLFSPDMSKDSCMLKDCVSKAPATKNSSVLPNGPHSTNLVWHEAMIHTFWGLSPDDVSWANHKTTKSGRPKQGSPMVPPGFHLFLVEMPAPCLTH